MAERAVPVRVSGDVVVARRAVRELAREMGFGSADQTRLATATSELARNALQYAGGGSCTFSDVSDDTHRRLRVVLEDRGPGIADVALAMTDGYSGGNGLGTGLPGSKRLVTEFSVDTEPGHTVVTIVLARRLR